MLLERAADSPQLHPRVQPCTWGLISLNKHLWKEIDSVNGLTDLWPGCGGVENRLLVDAAGVGFSILLSFTGLDSTEGHRVQHVTLGENLFENTSDRIGEWVNKQHVWTTVDEQNGIPKTKKILISEIFVPRMAHYSAATRWRMRNIIQMCHPVGAVPSVLP